MPEKIFNTNTARRENMVRKVLMIVAICVFICSSSTFAATLTLPRTGQTASYATGDDGDLKAGVPWPAQRFTSGTGSEIDCITDNLTGLMWAKAGLASANWGSALSTINASNLCGHDDWRMPNINEFESLVNAGETSTAAWLNSQGFTSLAGAYYWTSTTRMDLLNQAFVIDLGPTATYEVFFRQKDNSHSTLPVRGTTSGPAPLWVTGQTLCYDFEGAALTCLGTGQDGDIQAGVAWPVTRFEITYCNASAPCPSQASDCDANTATDIVTDNLTGLVWARNPGTTSNAWQGALTYANDLPLCGYNDWRMPNRKELRSLTNYGTSNGAGYLAGQGFQNVQNLYWTATTSAVTPANAYINYFAPAEKVEEWSKTGVSCLPWAVRAGGASDISLSPGALDFGDVVYSLTSPIQTITITNTGSIDLVISSTEMEGTSPTMFAAVQGATNGCAIPNAIVNPGASCTLDVTFTPTALDLQEALLYINSNDPDTPRIQVSLSGNGVQFLYAPLEGTVGTEITIQGGGDLGDKKGKVLIGTVAAKVTSWTNTRITATVKKVPLPVGPYKVSFSTKFATITLPDDFTVKNPELDPLTDDNKSGFPEEEIVLTGRFFGTKKGKVYLEELSSGKKKSCKVTKWYMNPATGESEIRFIVPKVSKSFTLGPHPLTIVNKIGVAAASENFVVGLP